MVKTHLEAYNGDHLGPGAKPPEAEKVLANRKVSLVTTVRVCPKAMMEIGAGRDSPPLAMGVQLPCSIAPSLDPPLKLMIKFLVTSYGINITNVLNMILITC
jgi:hypothetical protein